MAITKIKMKIWTERGSTELSGGGKDNGQDALDQLLIATGDRAARVKALEQLQACHQRVCEWEDRAAAPSPADNGGGTGN